MYSVRVFKHSQFSVDESCVRRWKLQRERLLKTPRNKRAQRYRPAAFPDIEKELAAWITEKRQGGIGVSTNVICLKAKSVAQKFGIAKESFKASKRWCYGFMHKGKNMTLNLSTSETQTKLHLPSTLRPVPQYQRRE